MFDRPHYSTDQLQFYYMCSGSDLVYEWYQTLILTVLLTTPGERYF